MAYSRQAAASMATKSRHSPGCMSPISVSAAVPGFHVTVCFVPWGLDDDDAIPCRVIQTQRVGGVVDAVDRGAVEGHRLIGLHAGRVPGDRGVEIVGALQSV